MAALVSLVLAQAGFTLDTAFCLSFLSDAITEMCHHTWLNVLKYKGEIYFVGGSGVSSRERKGLKNKK